VARIAFPLLGLGNFGGVRKVLEIANGLVDYGHEISILYPRERSETTFHIRPEVKRVEVPGRNRLSALLRFVPLVKGYDMIVANFWPTAYLFPFSRRMIYFVQDVESRFYSNPIFKVAAHLTYSFPLVKVTYNPALAKLVHAQHVIPAGVDKNTFFPDPDPSLKRDLPVVMYMPRKERRKGFDIFLKVIELLAKTLSFEIWFVGGRDVEIPQLPLSTRRFFPRNDTELRRLYSSADVFVLSSRTEGLGFPVLESLACGTPVVATDVDGAAVWNLPGVEVVPPTSEALTSGLKKVLSSLKMFKKSALSSGSRIAHISDMVFAFNKAITKQLSTL